MNVLITPGKVSGQLLIPASKSLSHRALICAGLAEGTSSVYNLGHSQDIEATRNCLQALGAKFKDDPQKGCVHVSGCRPQDLVEPVTLNANESGSTLRFFIPIAAAGKEGVAFLGKPSLLTRPLGIYANIFLEQGLPFEQGPEGLHFHGPLQPGLYTLNGDVSSQFISGLLLAGPLMEGMEIAVLPPYQSRSYVDLTVSMLETFGCKIEQPTDHAYRIDPGQRLRAKSVQVESDWSQAAFFLTLGMLNAPLTLKGLKKDSLQGDAIISSMIEQAGGKLEWKEAPKSENESEDAGADVDTNVSADPDSASCAPGPDPDSVSGFGAADLYVSPDTLRPFTFDLANCPDLGPILCVLAAMIPGTSRLIHAGRLRIKECDRIAAMEDELRKWGVEISSDEDSMTIVGKSANKYQMDSIVQIDGHNDHRIVMAMAVFGLCAKTPSIIHGAQAVAKSYPDFFKDLALIHGQCMEVNE